MRATAFFHDPPRLVFIVVSATIGSSVVASVFFFNCLTQLLHECLQNSLTNPVFSFTQFESGTSEKPMLHRLSRASPLQFKTLHNTPG